MREEFEYAEFGQKKASNMILSMLKTFKEIFHYEINSHMPSNEMFLNHLQLLSQRLITQSELDDKKDTAVYLTASKTYKAATNCVNVISQNMISQYNCTLTTTEKLYLLIHIQNIIAEKKKLLSQIV